MSYTLYEQIVGDKPKVLNINRAWHIGQQISMFYICGTTCARCNSTYVSIKEFPEPYKFCPICDSSIDSTGRQKWKQLQQRLKKVKTFVLNIFCIRTAYDFFKGTFQT